MIDSVKKYKVLILLFGIFLIGAFLRFYRISDVPVSLYWDEISSAYNSYSILHTGKDEFGRSLPLLFRAFEDYKTPANIYLMTIPVAIFGLNELSARFTSAALGSMSVILVFFLVKEIFGKIIEIKEKKINADYVGLLAAFLFAISPWSLQFSRTGFEANSGLFFVILGITLLLKFVNRAKFKFYYLGITSLAISIYFYRSIWVFVPLMFVSVLFFYRKLFLSKEKLKKTILGLFLFAILLAPFAPVMISKEGMTRTRQVNVVSNSFDKTYEAAKKQVKSGNNLASKAIYNRRLVYIEIVVLDYLKHFGPKFLFISGDGNGRHSVPGFGVMYLWEAAFLLIGFFLVMKIDKKKRNIVIAWLLIAPITASLSVPSPHALRSLNMLPIPQILTALGLIYIFYLIQGKWRYVFIGFITAIVILFFASYFNAYYSSANSRSSDWADGYKELITYVQANQNQYDKVVVSGHYWQPYVYFLFYTKHNPADFQKNGSKSGFDKYIFGGTSWDMNGKELGDQNLEKVGGSRNILVALSPVEYDLQKNNIKVVKEIKNHNNELVFIVGTLK